MTKAEGVNAAAAALLGDGARAVPFTATVDPQGRLTSFEIDMSGINSAAGKMTTTYSDFGTAGRRAASPGRPGPGGAGEHPRPHRRQLTRLRCGRVLRTGRPPTSLPGQIAARPDPCPARSLPARIAVGGLRRQGRVCSRTHAV